MPTILREKNFHYITLTLRISLKAMNLNRSVSVTTHANL